MDRWGATIIALALAVGIVTLVLGSPYSKFNYEVNEEFQNTIQAQVGESPLPRFFHIPPYFIIGAIFSLSFPNGVINPDGYQNVLALKCAIADMNVIGPSMGIPIVWFSNIFNDKHQPSTALRAAVQLLNAGVPVTLGPTQSDAAIAVTALSSAFNVTKLSGVVSVDILSDILTYGTLFRVVPPDRHSAQLITSIMVHFNWTLVTPIFTDDTYGLSGLKAYSAAAIDRNVLSTCGRVIPPGGLTGIQNTINCLSTSQSSVVLLWMEAVDAFNVIIAFYESGLLPDLTFIATPTWGDVRDIELYTRGKVPASYLEGSISVIPSPGNQTVFRDCLREHKVDTLGIPFFQEFLEASLRCRLPESETEDLSGLPTCPQDFSERGVYPNLTCACGPGDNMASIAPLYTVNYIYDAAFTVFSALNQIYTNCTGVSEATGIDFCGQESLSSSHLTAAIKITQFTGVTGEVAFSGNDPVRTLSRPYMNTMVDLVGVAYDIDQRRDDGTLIVLGVGGINGTLLIDNELLQWKNGRLPISAIVPSEITFSEPIGWAALIFIIIALLIAFACAIYFFVNRKEKVIKKTSPFFSQLMLLGIVLCVSSQIFWDIKQSTFTCILKIWLLAIGFGLIMGNLLAKTYRIFKIFNNARVTSLVIRDVDLLKFTGAILLLEILMLCFYCFVSGLPRPVPFQSTSDSLLKIIKCQVPSTFVQLGGTITLFAVNFVLVLAAVIVAFLTRNVDSAFNESIYIAYVVYIYMLVSIILLPLYYTAGDSPSSNSRQFIIRTIAILVPMFFTLGALFGPKVYLVHQSKKAEKRLAGADRERAPGRRVVDFGASTGGAGQPTAGYGEGYSTAGAGAFTTVIRGNAPTTTSSSENETVIMPGGPKASAGSASTATGAESTYTLTRPSTSGTTGDVPSNEYSNLIKSVTKKSQ